MSETKKVDKMPAWKAESYNHRALQCIALLYINGVITPSERQKAHIRLLKQVRAGK